MSDYGSPCGVVKLFHDGPKIVPVLSFFFAFFIGPGLNQILRLFLNYRLLVFIHLVQHTVHAKPKIFHHCCFYFDDGLYIMLLYRDTRQEAVNGATRCVGVSVGIHHISRVLKSN